MTALNIKNAITGALVVLAAVSAAEVFLRFTVGKELIFETWFTPGVHVPDTKFGFRYQPYYSGFMWHPDGVWGIPFQTDRYGYRAPVAGNRDTNAHRIDIIGGASMMMSYGLPDTKTIHGQAVAKARHNLVIHNSAWPGFDLYRNWHLYKTTLATQDTPDILVVGIVNAKPADYAWFPSGYRALPQPPPENVLFRFFDGLVLPPSSELQFRLGPDYYRTFVSFKALRAAEYLLGTRQNTDIEAALGPEIPTTAEVRKNSTGVKRFSGFIKYLHRQMSAQGSRMLVVFLPFENLDKDFYDDLEASLPADQPVINIHRVLYDEIQPTDFIAAGHYNRRLSALIGQQLAHELDRLLVD